MSAQGRTIGTTGVVMHATSDVVDATESQSTNCRVGKAKPPWVMAVVFFHISLRVPSHLC
jgi:hypothetical protein